MFFVPEPGFVGGPGAEVPGFDEEAREGGGVISRWIDRIG